MNTSLGCLNNLEVKRLLTPEIGEYRVLEGLNNSILAFQAKSGRAVFETL